MGISEAGLDRDSSHNSKSQTQGKQITRI